MDKYSPLKVDGAPDSSGGTSDSVERSIDQLTLNTVIDANVVTRLKFGRPEIGDAETDNARRFTR